MRCWSRLLSVCLTAAAFVPAAQAEQTAPLLILDRPEASTGWDAVGRLNFGTDAFCTGSLIAEDIVLTAAHCVFDAKTGDRFEPQSMQFLAGWRDGFAVARRGVSQVVLHPDFSYSAEDRVGRVAHDLALIRLDAPIPAASVTPLTIDVGARRGDTVGVVSYAKQQHNAASVETDCRVLARQGGVLVLSCTVDHGASGSPVFILEDGKAPRIVSVVSAMAQVRKTDVSLGTTLAEPMAVFDEILSGVAAPTPAEPQQITRLKPVVRTMGSGTTTQESGAKFLRPVN